MSLPSTPIHSASQQQPEPLHTTDLLSSTSVPVEDDLEAAAANFASTTLSSWHPRNTPNASLGASQSFQLRQLHSETIGVITETTSTPGMGAEVNNEETMPGQYVTIHTSEGQIVQLNADVIALTKQAKANLQISEGVGIFNGAQRLATFGITAFSPNDTVTYATLGTGAFLQYSTTYMSIFTGQVSEKMFSGAPRSNVESDHRKIIMSGREVLAILSQATAASNLALGIKLPVTASITSLYGAMLVFDGVSEAMQGHKNLKEADPQYRMKTDKVLLVKIIGLTVAMLTGASLAAGSFAIPKENTSDHEWILAAGSALMGASLTGGISYIADHFKQKNRALRYSEDHRSFWLKGFEGSMSIRSSLGLVTQLVSLTAPHAKHAKLATKIIGGVVNVVASASGMVRPFAYREQITTHIAQEGSGINAHPENSQQTQTASNKSLTGKITKPLNKIIASTVKIGINANRHVIPRSWIK